MQHNKIVQISAAVIPAHTDVYGDVKPAYVRIYGVSAGGALFVLDNFPDHTVPEEWCLISPSPEED